MQSKFLRSLTVFLVAWLLGNTLASCGQKGDLYLPDEKKQAETKRN
jgi:predicted small lipoprotein YifL